MDNAKKRDLVRAYKERKSRRGVFAVRCTAAGECWASSSMDLDKQQNSTWFMLKTGSHPNRALQAAWNVHGDAAFTYDVVEELNDVERSDYAVRSDLKDLEVRWRASLNARPVTG